MPANHLSLALYCPSVCCPVCIRHLTNWRTNNKNSKNAPIDWSRNGCNERCYHCCIDHRVKSSFSLLLAGLIVLPRMHSFASWPSMVCRAKVWVPGWETAASQAAVASLQPSYIYIALLTTRTQELHKAKKFTGLELSLCIKNPCHIRHLFMTWLNNQSHNESWIKICQSWIEMWLENNHVFRINWHRHIKKTTTSWIALSLCQQQPTIKK
jgi:hypothetical protein